MLRTAPPKSYGRRVRGGDTLAWIRFPWLADKLKTGSVYLISRGLAINSRWMIMWFKEKKREF
jgi:hypothetical protein